VILDVTTSDLRRYLGLKRKEGDKQRTIVKRRSAISQFYQVLKILAEDDVISLSPSDVPENPEDGFNEKWSVDKPYKSQQDGGKPYLKPGEVQKLYQHVPTPLFRNKLICRILYQSGMRRSELAMLRVSDVKPIDNQEITVRADTSKSGKQRTVYYKENLIPDLRRWIDGGLRDAENGATNSSYLFPTRESKHIHPNHITQIVKEAASNADLQAHVYTDSGQKNRDRVTPHTLRHSYAINMLRPPNPVDVRTLQAHLGHADLETTEEYLDIVREDAKVEYTRVGGPPENSD